jgi:hypothetical protein
MNYKIIPLISPVDNLIPPVYSIIPLIPSIFTALSLLWNNGINYGILPSVSSTRSIP